MCSSSWMKLTKQQQCKWNTVGQKATVQVAGQRGNMTMCTAIGNDGYCIAAAALVQNQVVTLLTEPQKVIKMDRYLTGTKRKTDSASEVLETRC